MRARTPGDHGWLIRQVGRRGTLLGLLGVLWAALGIGFATSPQPRFADGADMLVLRWIDDITSPWLGLLWVVCGLVSLGCAIARYRSPRDDYGFVALVFPAVVWGVFYVWSWVAFLFPSYPEVGRPNSWLAALVYWSVALILLFVSRWPDPDDPHAGRGRPQEDA